jgi:Capsule polysaccharide biosynthesis protein
MNILIYSINPQPPHLETDYELALQFIDRGDNVTIVRCMGQLKSCFANPNHNFYKCAWCKSAYSNIKKISGTDRLNEVTIPIGHYEYDFPEYFKNIDELKSFQYQGLDAGNAVATTLIGIANKDHKFDTIKYKAEIQRELKMWIDTYWGMQQVLTDIKPDGVCLFNGRFSSYHALRWLCIEKNITYYTHERAGVLGKYILRENAMPHDIVKASEELESLWGEGGDEKEELGTKFFTDRRNRVIQSWISFVEMQEKGLLPQGFDKSKKNIVIFNSTMEEYEGMADYASPFYRDDNEGIRQILESFKEDEAYQFYLRVHPNLKLLDNSQMKEIGLLAKQYKNLHLIKPEEHYDSYALLDHADKVVVFGSTIGVEATFWGKTSILLGKSLYMGIDAVYEPTSHTDAVAMMKDDELGPKNKNNSLKYGYWELMKGVPFKHFAQSGLFSMTYKDQIIAPNKVWAIIEKFTVLRLLLNKRGRDDFKRKINNLLKT